MSDSLLIFGAARADRPVTRFGLSVSKRVGGAVTRNRVKRRLRECMWALDLEPGLEPGYNIVVSARQAAANADYHRLLTSVRRLAKRAGVLRTTAGVPD